MDKHAMFDCESLGVGNNPVLLSIACVIFLENGKIIDRVHYHIDIEDSNIHKLKFSGSTIMWGLSQSQGAREAILKGQERSLSLVNALGLLDRTLVSYKPETVWSYGAASDLVWLKSAYKAIGTYEPWTYKQERCLRTIGAIYDPEGELRPEPTVKHDALADAESQAEWLVRMANKSCIIANPFTKSKRDKK